MAQNNPILTKAAAFGKDPGFGGDNIADDASLRLSQPNPTASTSDILSALSGAVNTVSLNTIGAAENAEIDAAIAKLGVGSSADDTFASTLAQLQGTIESQAVNNANTIDKLTSLDAAQTNAGAIMQSALKAAGEASATIALTKDTAAMEAQNRTIAAYQAVGGTQIQEQLMTELGNDVAHIEGLEDAISAIFAEAGSGLLGQIVGGFNSIQERKELKRAKENRNSTTNNIAAITGSTQSIAQANLATQRTVNEGTISANQTLILTNSKVKATQAQLDTLNSNAGIMSQISAANQTQIQNQLQSLKLIDSSENREIQKQKLVHRKTQMTHEIESWAKQADSSAVALESAKLSLESAKLRNPTQQATAELRLEEAQKQIAKTKATEDAMVESVHKAQAAFGTVAKGTQEESGVILAGIRRRDPKYLTLLEKGSAPTTSFGSTPAEARRNFTLVAPTGNVQPTKITKLLTDIEGEMNKSPNIPKNQLEFDAAFDKVANGYMAQQAANIKAGDASNPMQAPPMDTLLLSDDLKLQPLYTKVLAPMNMTEVIPQAIVDAAVSGIASKQISIDEAISGIEAIFDLSAIINNEQDNGFKAIGLPSQTTYNTSIERPPNLLEELSTGFKSVLTTSPISQVSTAGAAAIGTGTLAGITSIFGGAKSNIVDLMDPVAIRQMMVEQLNARASSVDNNVGGSE